MVRKTLPECTIHIVRQNFANSFIDNAMDTLRFVGLDRIAVEQLNFHSARRVHRNELLKIKCHPSTLLFLRGIGSTTHDLHSTTGKRIWVLGDNLFETLFANIENIVIVRGWGVSGFVKDERAVNNVTMAIESNEQGPLFRCTPIGQYKTGRISLTHFSISLAAELSLIVYERFGHFAFSTSPPALVDALRELAPTVALAVKASLTCPKLRSRLLFHILELEGHRLIEGGSRTSPTGKKGPRCPEDRKSDTVQLDLVEAWKASGLMPKVSIRAKSSTITSAAKNRNNLFVLDRLLNSL
ncbi:hypothetical protein RF11_13615 [Thelohanellus kitauei]|uniref:Uncharacterized protein n=1 Tax=Thelohanellus kitauei TaxID=669202 RepID=A0A0C2MGS7_THEKT|nr:hypothetical protein RF11_13615 [Thelohanellus kitauei]